VCACVCVMCVCVRVQHVVAIKSVDLCDLLRTKRRNPQQNIGAEPLVVGGGIFRFTLYLIFLFPTNTC